MRQQCRRPAFHLVLVTAMAVVTLLVGRPSLAQEESKGKESSKSVGAFGEGRRGDVPEGTMEMLTPETDKAIQSGLAWLAHSQNADGSFGTSTYRGNIAVTSLAGLAFMSVGLQPRPRSLWSPRSTRPCPT